MNIQPIPISLVLLSAIYAGVSLLIWGRRPGLAIMPFARMMFSVAIWSLGYGFELMAPDLSGKLFWAKMETFGVSSIPIFLFFFCAAYTGRSYLLNNRNRVLIWIIPAITIILTWTTPFHYLIWMKTSIGYSGPLSYLVTDFGIWMWLHVAYSYMLILLGSIFLFLEVLRSPKPYNIQAGIILVGILFPWVASFLYLSNTVLPGIDFTPFAFIPTVLLMAWGSLRYHLLGILPAAPSMILQGLQDGVVVIDIRRRILYLNNLAEQILQTTVEEAIGQPIGSVCGSCMEILQRLIEQKGSYAEQEFTLGVQKRFFDIRVSPLSAGQWGTNDVDASHLITLRDIHERKQIELNLQHRQQTLNMLHEIIVSALQTNDRHSMAQTIVDHLGKLINPDGCFLSLWDEVSEKLLPLAAYGSYSKEYLSLTTMPDEPTLTASALIVGHYLIVENISNTPYLSPRIAAMLPFHSALVFPLVSGHKKFGAILLAYVEAHHFQPEEISIGEQAAGLIALILEKFYTVEYASRRAEEAEILRKAGAAVASTLHLDEAIDRILEQLSRVIAYDSASVQLLRENELEIVGGCGWERPEDVLGLRFPVPDDNPNTIVLETGKPYILADAIAAHSSFREEGPHSHIRSWLGVPLTVRGGVIGLLAIDSTKLNYFTEDHLEIVSTFADQVAIALENARLFEETQNHLQDQIMIRDAVAIISSALDTQTILTRLAEQLSIAVDATSAYISKYDEKTEGFTVIAEYISDHANEKERLSDLGATYPRIRDKDEDEFLAHMHFGHYDISHIDDPEISQNERDHMQRYGGKSILYIPLKVKDILIGFAEIWESRQKRNFSSEEIDLCLLIAQQAAIALENARLFEEVQNMAFTDPLTGLYNRRGLFEIGHIEFSRSYRLKRPFSVIMIDIDHFKHVNDQYGHPAGDRVLQFLASELHSIVRGTEIVGRYGGEEFAIFLSGSDSIVAMELAERIRKTIEITPIQVEGNQIELTISLGVSEYNENNPNLETLVTRSDQALYVSKHKGRNCVSLGK